MPLLGAVAGCHCSVLWLSGRGAIAGCHCRVPLQGAVDVVPLLGAFVGCHCSVPWLGEGDDQLNFGGVDVASDNTKIGFCYLGSMLV